MALEERNGIWYWRKTIKGHPFGKSTGTSDRKEAEVIATIWEADALREIVLQRTRPVTLHAVIKAFLDARGAARDRGQVRIGLLFTALGPASVDAGARCSHLRHFDALFTSGGGEQGVSHCCLLGTGKANPFARTPSSLRYVLSCDRYERTRNPTRASAVRLIRVSSFRAAVSLPNRRRR
jgi:hypothetical protein